MLLLGVELRATEKLIMAQGEAFPMYTTNRGHFYETYVHTRILLDQNIDLFVLFSNFYNLG